MNKPKPITKQMIHEATRGELRKVAYRHGVTYSRLRRALLKKGIHPQRPIHFERRSRISSETNPAPESAKKAAVDSERKRIRAARWVVLKEGRALAYGANEDACRKLARVIGECVVVLNNARAREAAWVET